MYHPGLGRFSTRDPIEYDAGDANLYRYVFDAPVDNSDPSGLQLGFYDYGGTISEGKYDFEFYVPIGPPKSVAAPDNPRARREKWFEFVLPEGAIVQGDVILSKLYAATALSITGQVRTQRRWLEYEKGLGERLYDRVVKFEITELRDVWEVTEVHVSRDKYRDSLLCRAKLINRLARVKRSSWGIYRFRDKLQFNQMNNSNRQSFWTLDIEPFRPDKVPESAWLRLRLYPQYRILPGYAENIPARAFQAQPPKP